MLTTVVSWVLSVSVLFILMNFVTHQSNKEVVALLFQMKIMWMNGSSKD